MSWRGGLLVAVVAILTIFASVAVLSRSVYAEDILKEACSTNADSPTCKSATKPNQNPLSGTDGLLYKVSRIIAAIAGVCAVFLIAISGFRYITSGGDAQKVASAKHALVGAIVGLLVIVLAQAIITFVVKGIT